MEITKAKITKDNTLIASYINEHGDTVTIEGKNLVTKDMHQAFKALIPHLTFLCEQREAYRLVRMDELPDEIYRVLDVSGYSIGGSDDNIGVTLIGKRFLNSKKVLNINAPFTMFDNENEEYTYAFDLQQAIENCNYEVEQYLFEKKWAVVQQELPFDEGIGAEVQPDEIKDVEDFVQAIEDIVAEAGTTVTITGTKVKGRHRKVKKETVAA